MKVILTYKLLDGTKFVFITPSKLLSEAHHRAVKFSNAIFTNPKFVIKEQTEIYNNERWNDSRLTGLNTIGSKEYLAAVIYNGSSKNFCITADSEKAAYNKIKETNGLADFSLFLYDRSQDNKIISVYTRANFLLGNRPAFDKFMDNLYAHADNIKPLKPYISDLKEFENLIHDYMSGAYKQIPMNTLVTIIGILLYFVSPVNLSFEWIPVIGQLDDIALVAMLGHELRKDIAEYKTWKTAATANKQIGLSDDVIENEFERINEIASEGLVDKKQMQLNKENRQENFERNFGDGGQAGGQAGHYGGLGGQRSKKNSFELNPVDKVEKPPTSIIEIFKRFS